MKITLKIKPYGKVVTSSRLAWLLCIKINTVKCEALE